MRRDTRSILFALVVCLAAGVPAGCDRGDKPADRPAATQSTAGGGASTGAASAGGAAARDACPTEAEIAAVIGSPVKRLKGIGCSYQSEDKQTDVSILITGAAGGDKLLEEMRETAGRRPNVKVEPVAGIGERAHMYATPGQATAVAVGGGKAYWVDISSVGGAAVDRKPQVIQILRLLMR
jgi:hypothetical protein